MQRPIPPNPATVGKRSVTVAWPVMDTARYVKESEEYMNALETELRAAKCQPSSIPDVQTFEQWKQATHPHVDRVTTVFMREAWKAEKSQPKQEMPPQLVSDRDFEWLARKEMPDSLIQRIAHDLKNLRAWAREKAR